MPYASETYMKSSRKFSLGIPKYQTFSLSTPPHPHVHECSLVLEQKKERKRKSETYSRGVTILIQTKPLNNGGPFIGLRFY